MHRVPLGIAILILIFQLFLAFSEDNNAYRIDKEKLWLTILINSVFIIISICRLYINIKEGASISQDTSTQQKNQFIQEDLTLQINYNKARDILLNNPTEEGVHYAINLLVENAKKNHVPSIQMLQTLHEITARNKDDFD